MELALALHLGGSGIGAYLFYPQVADELTYQCHL